MDETFSEIFERAGCTGTVAAMRLDDGATTGLRADALVTPASVLKVQVALTALDAFERGQLDGATRVQLPAGRRTPGPVGISLFTDDVDVSLRDLVTLMLTISDNVATDAVIAAVGLDAVNRLTRGLGLVRTHVTSDLASMLDAMAREVGFADYRDLAAYEPVAGQGPSSAEVRHRLAHSSALDPTRGSRTTASEAVELLRMIWDDTAALPAACRRLRLTLAQQLTRHRLASGFGPDTHVAAKSGGLMGVVRNEVGVVSVPGRPPVAVAVFTRTDPSGDADPRAVDAAVGEAAALGVRLLTD